MTENATPARSPKAKPRGRKRAGDRGASRPEAGLARAWLRPVGLYAPMLLTLLGASRVRAFTIDDAYISFRYAENLASGHGLVYNLGERVEGYTNFLWVVLLAL